MSSTCLASSAIKRSIGILGKQKKRFTSQSVIICVSVGATLPTIHICAARFTPSIEQSRVLNVPCTNFPALFEIQATCNKTGIVAEMGTGTLETLLAFAELGSHRYEGLHSICFQ